MFLVLSIFGWLQWIFVALEWIGDDARVDFNEERNVDEPVGEVYVVLAFAIELLLALENGVHVDDGRSQE